MSVHPTDTASSVTRDSYDVAIIGAGLTGLTTAYQLHKAGHRCIVIEKANRVGGQIRSHTTGGFCYELGPNTATLANYETLELVTDPALGLDVQVADAASKYRWIWKADRFYSLPTGPLSALTTPLFTLQDKLRILGEPWRAPGSDPQETIGSLAERRLGKSFVDYAVEPFIGAIYAGDPYRLVTKYALSKLYDLEQRHGSFIRGTFAKRKADKADPRPPLSKDIFSVRGGMERLPEALAAQVKLSGEVVTGVRDARIERTEASASGWRVRFGGRTITAHHVISTVPASALPHILPPKLRTQISPITALTYAPVMLVSVGFEHLPGVNRRAFGGLVPRVEHRDALGVLFLSSCFPGRTRYKDGAIFSVFLGGIHRGAEYLQKSEAELQEIALRELYQMLRIPSNVNPDLVNVAIYPEAIPQYDERAAACHERIGKLEATYPGLHLAGSIRDGVGVAKRILQGTELAREIDAELAGRDGGGGLVS